MSQNMKRLRREAASRNQLASPFRLGERLFGQLLVQPAQVYRHQPCSFLDHFSRTQAARQSQQKDQQDNDLIRSAPVTNGAQHK